MLELRLATPTDESLLKIFIETAYHEYPRLIARGGSSLEAAVEVVFESIISEEGFAHIARLNGEDIGAAWWVAEAPDRTLNVAYFVAPNTRKQGVASRLLEAGLLEAKKRDALSVQVKTHPDNAASIALARKIGFEPVVALFRHDLASH